MKKTGIRVIGILIAILILSAAGLLYIHKNYKITEMEIEGIHYYTEEQMKSYLLGQIQYDNSLYMWWFFHTGRGRTIPYVDSMDFEIQSPHRVKITVYEKGIVGYFSYLGINMYFDKDGMLVDSSEDVLNGVPKIEGIMFDELTLNEKIPVQNDEIFQAVVETANVLKLSKLEPDVISFSRQLEITLTFGDICVLLGDRSNLNEKTSRLAGILPNLEGEKGTLYLNDYSIGKKSITFSRSEDEK